MQTIKMPRYKLPRLTVLALILEIAAIIYCGYRATPFTDLDPTVQVQGGEVEWLTNSMYLLTQNLQKHGYISLWQPFLSSGEPAIENPFSFALNPISLFPSLALGPVNGIKFSVVLYCIFAGLGGWVLGRVLGLGMLGRLLLGILLTTKGNMLAYTSAGYYQLGVTQAYLPWVIAGAVGVLRFPRSRWSVVLLALSLALLFWGGNIYFTLPSVVGVGLLTLTHIFDVQQDQLRARLVVYWSLVRRMIFTALLTIGIAAVTLIPIWVHQNSIGKHPNEPGNGRYADLLDVSRMFFFGDTEWRTAEWALNDVFSYHTFVLPFWLAVTIFLLIPPIYPWLHRPPNPRREWRVWAVGIFMVVFFLLWGTGNNPIVGWLYQNVPLFGQWRFVPRMLGVASFWLLVLAAMRIDGLYRALTFETSILTRIPRIQIRPAAISSLLLIAGTISLFASYRQVNDVWGFLIGPGAPNPYVTTCLNWLRQTNPDRPLSVYTLYYWAVRPYISNEVRLANITADFQVLGQEPTLFKPSLINANVNLPEFALPNDGRDRAAYMDAFGYKLVLGSPSDCILRRDEFLSYAFTVPLDTLQAQTDSLPPNLTTPITALQRLYDRVGVIVPGGSRSETVLVVQETAYPGWNVYVNGQPAQIESVGQLIGVVLPPSDQPQQVYFEFRPALSMLSAWISILSVVIAGLYLLRIDRFIPQRYTTIGEETLQKVVTGAARVLMNDTLLTPKDDEDVDRPDVVLLPARTETRPEEETKLLEATPAIVEESGDASSDNGMNDHANRQIEDEPSTEVDVRD